MTPRDSTSLVRCRAALLAALLGGAGAGCRAEVGECDETSARQVVYLDTGNAASSGNGSPMYAGQALMHATCGSGQFCHSQDARSVERYGVPAGLDFDVQYACDQGPCDTSEDEAGIARLSANQLVILDYASEILTSVRNGRMPPDGIGETIVEQAGRFRVIDESAQSPTLYTEVLPCNHPLTSCAPGETTQQVETPFLSAIGTPEGNEILRNWLACGAPVVESAKSDPDEAPGSPCGGVSGAGHAGDCVHGVPVTLDVPDPTWTSIYTEVIEPLCGVSCHGGTPSFVEESQLDLSNQQLAYESIVGEVAKGQACAGVGTLIVPNDSAASLFIDKLTPEPLCGDPMPSAETVLPNEVVDVIRAWVDAGAQND